jgi:hypothetical protein
LVAIDSALPGALSPESNAWASTRTENTSSRASTFYERHIERAGVARGLPVAFSGRFGNLRDDQNPVPDQRVAERRRHVVVGDAFVALNLGVLLDVGDFLADFVDALVDVPAIDDSLLRDDLVWRERLLLDGVGWIVNGIRG